MYKRLSLVFILIISIFIFPSCNDSSVGLPDFNPGDKASPDELSLNRLFPVENGRKWIYTSQETNYSYYYNRIISDDSCKEEWKVSKEDTEPVLIKRIYEDNAGETKTSVMSLSQTQVELLWTGFEENSDIHQFNGKLLISPLQINSSWNTLIPFEGKDFYIEIPGINRISTISDIVTTPAGTFNHCVRTDFTANERLNVSGAGLSNVNGALSYWYAPDIGIVQIRIIVKVQSIDNNTINESREIVKVLDTYGLSN